MKKKLTIMLLSAIMLITSVNMYGCGSGSQETDSESKQEQTTGTEEEKEEKGDAQETAAAGDQEESSPADDTEYPLTITDSLGNEVDIEKEPEQVISLSPANTEILFAIGGGSRVKGRTDYCNYPEEASEVTSIGTYSSPNTELILSLEPDVIFASDYIDDSIRKQVEDAGIKVVVFSANSVEEIEDVILQAGQILNLNQNAEDLTASMNEDLADIQDTASSIQEKKTVFVDLGSFYSAGPGSLIDNELNIIGAENIAADSGETWPELSVETIIEKNPDIYLSLYTTPEDLKKTAGLSELDCMDGDNLIYYDGLSEEGDLIQRAGPRIVEGIRLLAEKIYPDFF